MRLPSSPTSTTALLAAILLSCPSTSRADGNESRVAFNTTCARCHEAQCSGRLSFEDGYERSREHMIRHYPRAAEDAALRRELFALLDHMKERCGYYPMERAVAGTGRLDGESLDAFSTPVERNYFIPLGALVEGGYAVTLTLEREARVTVHVVSSRFEMAVDDCFRSADRRIEIPFGIEEPGEYFLRLYPREPARVIGLTLSPRPPAR